MSAEVGRARDGILHILSAHLPLPRSHFRKTVKNLNMADTKGKTAPAGAGAQEEVKPTVVEKENEYKLELGKDDKKMRKAKTITKAVLAVFCVLTVATALVSIALIAVSTMSAVAASAMDAQDDSGRLVGLIVLPVTAAVGIAIIIYAQIATCSSKIRPIFVAAIVLTILAVIQGIIAGAAVRVSPKDAEHIQQSLRDSFNLAARQHSPRHVKMWATTQSTFHCCGYENPFDYPHIGLSTPDVPISCCPTYDPARSDMVQEKERYMCKDRREYYETGCSGDVLLVISETAQWVFNVCITLIVLELLSAVFGAVLVKKRKDVAAAEDKESQDDKEANK